MNVYCLYFPNGKRYVGVESQTGKRIRDHERMVSLRRSSSHHQLVHYAIRKHGWENVRWRYLATNCSRSEAAQLERFFIRVMRLREIDWGYNRTAGGENELATVERTPEAIEKHRAAMLAKPKGSFAYLNTPESIAKRRASRLRSGKGKGRPAHNRGVSADPEAIAKMVATKRERGVQPNSGSFKAGNRPRNKGVPLTEEQRLRAGTGVRRANRGSFQKGRSTGLPGPTAGRVSLPAGPNGETRYFRPEQLI